ncbi:CD99 antigen-like protein 2 isoform X2 [Archocentrus centrarchus]|uniref:CD99 antigen-like protein 2 isoform X2 n=1 Tax=Archocentrus centrarchus TaxID=63155 RepID=UPI0011E9DB3F|nr:CD99 antigen-like protein 2 isoform X2 [Archocentrus centrarchus]
MMSYLWILLLGSLLAAHAKAQDEVTPAVETFGTPVPTSNVRAVVIEERGVEETVTAAEEPSLVSTAASEAEADQPADLSTEPEATDAPEGVEAQSVTPAIGKTEPVTPDVEANAPATTQAAESEDDAPGLVQTTVSVEEEPIINAGTTPAQEESGLDTTPAIGDKVADNEEAPTDAAANEESSTDEITTIVEDFVHPKCNTGFNLEKALETSLPEQSSDGFNLGDALNDNDENDENENLHAPSGGQSRSAFNFGGASNGDSDNPSTLGGKGHSGPAMGASESGGRQSQKGGSLAGILSAIVVAAVGAVAGYFTYQQKKLCFKNRQADPEAPHKADAAEAQSDPQVLSNLLNSS